MAYKPRSLARDSKAQAVFAAHFAGGHSFQSCVDKAEVDYQAAHRFFHRSKGFKAHCLKLRSEKASKLTKDWEAAWSKKLKAGQLQHHEYEAHMRRLDPEGYKPKEVKHTHQVSLAQKTAEFHKRRRLEAQNVKTID